MIKGFTWFLLFALSTPAFGEVAGTTMTGSYFNTTCGDYLLDTGEACDSGGVDAKLCDANCTTAVCGDSYVNSAAGEQCESGECCDTGTCLFKSAATVCRAAQDGCDPPEYCSGSSTTCPANTDPCHDTCETCTGSTCSDRILTDQVADATWSSGTTGCSGAANDVAFSNSGNVATDNGSYANVSLRNSLPLSGCVGIRDTNTLYNTCDVKTVVVRVQAQQGDPISNQFYLDEVCVGTQSGSSPMANTTCNGTDGALAEDVDTEFSRTLSSLSATNFAGTIAVGASLKGAGLDAHPGYIDFFEMDVTLGEP